MGSVRETLSSPGRSLELKSPVGAASMTYTFPLRKGRAKDDRDDGLDIVETIRWACVENPSLRDAMVGSDYLTTYDAASYEVMADICDRYNRAVDALAGSKTKWGDISSLTRVSRPHLRHILTMVYHLSVVDPKELNNYEAFSPGVYGEASFDLVCSILDELPPITGDKRFVDLGSGVGQVVLQVAALTPCSMSLGIEKAPTPASYAKNQEGYFKFWMAFFGKLYSPFKLIHGDFLDESYRKDIIDSSILYVNNFAFGPLVDQRLNEIFADLQDGTRIFSSKTFSPLNFKITDRTLKDIGCIMNISPLKSFKGEVSWTGKSVSFFLHVIDRARLERYFESYDVADDSATEWKKILLSLE